DRTESARGTRPSEGACEPHRCREALCAAGRQRGVCDSLLVRRLQMGFELRCAQSRTRTRRCARSRGQDRVSRSHRGRARLSARSQSARPVVYQRLWRALDAEPSPPLLGASEERCLSAAAARRAFRRTELDEHDRSDRQRAERELSTADMLARSCRCVRTQRSCVQLERTARLGRRVPRRRRLVDTVLVVRRFVGQVEGCMVFHTRGHRRRCAPGGAWVLPLRTAWVYLPLAALDRPDATQGYAGWQRRRPCRASLAAAHHLAWSDARPYAHYYRTDVL